MKMEANGRKKIRAVVVGCGNMGRIGVRYLLEKGIDIVGAFGVNPKTLGEDLGLVAGLDKPLGIKISSNLAGLLDETKPDVAVHAMYSTMAQNEAVFTTLLEHGVNIVTTCDDSHYSRDLEPDATGRIDAAAKRGGASLIGTGIQDVFFLNIGYAAAGASASLHSIDLSITNNLDDYGLTSAQGAGVGLMPKEFQAMIESRRQAQSVMTAPINSAICVKFGLTPIKQTLRQLPKVNDHAVYSNALQKKVEAGRVTGITEQLTTETAEGVTVNCEYGLYIYDEGEYDVTRWHLYGNPYCELEIPRCKTPEGTMATLINRIPDAINAAPGYYPNCELDIARMCVGNMRM